MTDAPPPPRPPLPRFYGRDGLNVRSYDARAAQECRLFEDHIPFYVAQAVAGAGPVLELGCGTGRVTLAVAEAGMEVTGLDLSPAMLALARDKRARAPAAVGERMVLADGDMTSFDLGRRFRRVIIPLRGFQELLTVHDQRAALACIREHLDTDGCLIFDLRDPRMEDVLVTADDAPLVLPPLDLGTTTLAVAILRRTNNPLTQVLTEVWRFTELAGDGTVLAMEEEVHSLRWTWRAEMRHLLELEGLCVVTESADFRGSRPAAGHQQVWTVRRTG